MPALAGMTILQGSIGVGLDGGYVRDWKDRKSNFEVIVGQSLPEDRDPRHLGLVHGHDRKPGMSSIGFTLRCA
ncbi:MAG: hypothetical protein ACREE5_07685 [Acetobacteraceae bacterium]